MPTLIDLGGLSQPVSIFIEKVSEAIGGYAKPYQIKRIAEAEAEAEKTKAVAQIQVSEMQRRSLQRLLIEEEVRQSNMEEISKRAVPKIEDTAKTEDVDKDWMANFFDKCRLTSDVEMQELWSAILAGEANTPGKFAKRTVNLMANLDKSDAELFNRLMRFGIKMHEYVPIIHDIKHAIFKSNGLEWNNLKHLDDIGLVRFDGLAGFQKTGIGKRGYVEYFGQRIMLEFEKESDNNMSVGHVLLTSAGQQLANVCTSVSIPEYADYFIEECIKLKIKAYKA